LEAAQATRAFLIATSYLICLVFIFLKGIYMKIKSMKFFAAIAAFAGSTSAFAAAAGACCVAGAACCIGILPCCI
jgi:hypothetical protein